MPFGTLFLGWLWRSTRRSRRGPMETKIVSAQNSIPQEQFPTPIVKINPRVWPWEVFNRKIFLNFNEPLWRHRWLIRDKNRCIRANFLRSFRWEQKKGGSKFFLQKVIWFHHRVLVVLDYVIVVLNSVERHLVETGLARSMNESGRDGNGWSTLTPNPLSLQSTLTPVEWKWIWSEGGSRASSESARALFSGFFHFFQLTKKDAGDPGDHQKIQIIIISIGFFDDRQSTVLIYIWKLTKKSSFKDKFYYVNYII